MKNRRRTGHSDGLTIVIKLGTSSIVNETNLQPQLSVLSSIVETICALRHAGHRVVLVSSGAIGMGLRRMQLKQKPKQLADKQALAAIGQGRLIALYDSLFSELNQPIAQILLTRNDISDRSRYINATKTLSSLLNMGVIPIVNENDTIAVQEIKFGDNDTLSAITAGMVMADYLFLLTDVDCVYTENPRRNPDAKRVSVVRDIEALRARVSTSTLGSSLGTGGMETKLIAAELATGAGVATVITHSSKPSNIFHIISSPIEPEEQGDPIELSETSETITGKSTGSSPQDVSAVPLHTIFLPIHDPLPDRRWWILHGLAPRGTLIIDQGAYKAVFRKSTASKSGDEGDQEGNGGRLLAAGVVKVEGTFAANQAVRIAVQRPKRVVANNGEQLESSVEDLKLSSTPADTHTTEFEIVQVGRGLANYNWQEIDRIKGLKSSQIEAVLGYMEREHVVEAISGIR